MVATLHWQYDIPFVGLNFISVRHRRRRRRGHGPVPVDFNFDLDPELLVGPKQALKVVLAEGAASARHHASRACGLKVGLAAWYRSIAFVSAALVLQDRAANFLRPRRLIFDVIEEMGRLQINHETRVSWVITPTEG
jgi:hypothetical protein